MGTDFLFMRFVFFHCALIALINPGFDLNNVYSIILHKPRWSSELSFLSAFVSTHSHYTLDLGF